MHRDLCDPDWLNTCPRANLGFKDKIEVLWGAKPTSFNCYERDEDCTRISSSAIYRFAQIILNNVCGKLPCTNEWLQVGLPYTNSIFASELGRDVNREQFATLFKDTVVFYGADWALVQDKVFSPVHGEWLAGIYHHAMTFDNLITFGGDYARPNLPLSMSTLLHDELVLALFCLILLAVRTGFRYYGVSETHRAYRLTVGFLLSFLLPLMVAIFEFAVLNLSPTNWLGLFGVLTFSLILSTEELQSKMGTLAVAAAKRSQEFQRGVAVRWRTPQDKEKE
jgi:hypothetical protein